MPNFLGWGGVRLIKTMSYDKNGVNEKRGKSVKFYRSV
jgi:hypothetical protein